MSRGFFGVAIYRPKTEVNVGSLFRTAHILGADFLCTIGKRYKYQSSDVLKSTKHLPLFHYSDFEDFYEHMPHDCRLVGVELDERAKAVECFTHPQRAIYMLGAEDDGLPPKVMDRCHDLVKLRGERSMNVAVAGSIVLYSRAPTTPPAGEEDA